MFVFKVCNLYTFVPYQETSPLGRIRPNFKRLSFEYQPFVDGGIGKQLTVPVYISAKHQTVDTASRASFWKISSGIFNKRTSLCGIQPDRRIRISGRLCDHRITLSRSLCDSRKYVVCGDYNRGTLTSRSSATFYTYGLWNFPISNCTYGLWNSPISNDTCGLWNRSRSISSKWFGTNLWSSVDIVTGARPVCLVSRALCSVNSNHELAIMPRSYEVGLFESSSA